MNDRASEGDTAMTATETATRISPEELAESLPDILERVRQHAERFIVVDVTGRELAVLGPPLPIKGITGRELAERLAGLEWPDEDFANDLEAARASQRPPKAPDWPD
jgi:hypothetical protein